MNFSMHSMSRGITTGKVNHICRIIILQGVHNKIYWDFVNPPGIFSFGPIFSLFILLPRVHIISYNLHHVLMILSDRGLQIETQIFQLLPNLNLQPRS